jgi:hypothetical protein
MSSKFEKGNLSVKIYLKKADFIIFKMKVGNSEEKRKSV